jgi:hypothetical protein
MHKTRRQNMTVDVDGKKAAHYDDRDHPLRRIATTRYPV